MLTIRTLLSEQALQIALLLLTATGYALATYGIKLLSQHLTSSAVLWVVFGFGLAILAEAFLLRQSELSVIYLSIIALETLLVLSLALLLGDRLSLGQIFGACLIVTGTFFVSV